MQRDELKAAVAQDNTVDLITNAVYLQDQSHSICGIKIYGSPWYGLYIIYVHLSLVNLKYKYF